MPAKPLTPEQLLDASKLKQKFLAWQAARRSAKQPWSQAWASEVLGFGQSAINQYLNGKIPLNVDVAVRFAKLMNSQVVSFSFAIALEIENFKQHSSFENDAPNTEESPVIQGTVPLISWVQAGNWNDAVDNLHLGEGERIATTYRKRKHTYALRVRGDSMEPRFPEGAILIVEPDENPESGSFVIIRQNGGEATFKQLQIDGEVRYLKPINPRYPIMEMKPDAVFCGIVKRVEFDV